PLRRGQLVTNPRGPGFHTDQLAGPTAVIPAAPSRLWKTEFPAYSVRNPIDALQKYSRRTRARAGTSGDGVGGAVRPPIFLEETDEYRTRIAHRRPRGPARLGPPRRRRPLLDPRPAR